MILSHHYLPRIKVSENSKKRPDGQKVTTADGSVFKVHHEKPKAAPATATQVEHLYSVKGNTLLRGIAEASFSLIFDPVQQSKSRLRFLNLTIHLWSITSAAMEWEIEHGMRNSHFTLLVNKHTPQDQTPQQEASTNESNKLSGLTGKTARPCRAGKGLLDTTRGLLYV